jgi:archaemetzincin
MTRASENIPRLRVVHDRVRPMSRPTLILRRAVIAAPLLAAFGGCRKPSKAAPAPPAPSASAPPAPVAPRGFDPGDPAFDADPESFPPKRPPRPGDWLARFPETGTTFEEYVRAGPVGRTEKRRRIVLQPLGDLGEGERRLLATLREYTEAFFDSPAVIAPDLPLPAKGRRARSEEGRRWTQHHTQVLLHEVLAPRLPDDAMAYLGITMGDLYPEAGWNFVFGEATFEERVGVYSLARYFPAFTGEKDTPEARRLGLLRSFKVLSHETGHMFSLHHCARFECLMNGSNSLDETDRSPAYECPVCLKKLAYNLRFDVRARYRRLAAIYRHEGLGEQVAWIEARLRKLGAG